LLAADVDRVAADVFAAVLGFAHFEVVVVAEVAVFVFAGVVVGSSTASCVAAEAASEE